MWFLFTCILLNAYVGKAQVVNSSTQVYTSGDGVFWHLTGTGNGPAILLKQNMYQGGWLNRRGSLGWMDNNNNKTEVLSWTDALNVGIGTSDPSFKLDVSGGFRLRNYNENIQDYTTFRIQGGNTLAHGLEIDFFGDPSRTNLPGTYYAGYGGAAIINVNDKPLVLGTANTSRLHISGIGNVGIGTNSPLHKLHISDGDIAFDAEQTERFIRINNSYGGAIRFRGNAITSADRSLQFGRFDGNNNWSPLMTIETNNGNVGVGIESPTEKFTVNGNVKAKKIIISQTNWPDYVFDSSYVLRSLSTVEKFITQNKRLPDMPSAKEVAQKGISVGDNQALLLKKIEELTLYVIELKKENIKQQEEINALKKDQ